MFYPLSIWIGLRYTRAERRNHFISFISFISTLGITLGVIVLITVLSVMNGFHKEVRERILGMASHADIRAASGSLEAWKPALEKALRHPRVVGAAPYVESQTMLVHGRQVSGALVRGIDPEMEPSVVEVGEHMQQGSLDQLRPGSFNIVLGRELALALGAGVGDRVTVLVPRFTATPTGSVPRMKRFTVSGIFSVGMGEYDRGVALVNLKDLAVLLKMKKGVTGIRLKLDDVFASRQVSLELARQFRGWFHVTDWTDRHRNFFAALRMEKRMMGLLLFFIVVIAAFNIVATLVMVVVDKRADIAILKTFGASPRQIMNIFIVQGSVIGLVGTLLGVVGGVALALNVEQVVAWIEQVFNVHFIDPDVYYISVLPSDLHWDDVALVGFGSFLCSFLMTLYPAWNAYRTLPAEALRYE
ncbi:MAG TPA: lipoprotein-releasing ABC transporter permease subunit [Thiolapillus brandeum]|uniref:Lipoprotein-releasing ABC transporter permease subunit n=1 Tax=Thiolapillus brandeum TaxID=1076588 RepID=A0A7C5N8U0_9GAMM|nr:lipoprotein-releasing ABC transporter permease subunit [Thiolapillus brandeum]